MGVLHWPLEVPGLFPFCNSSNERRDRVHERCSGFNARMRLAMSPELGHSLWCFPDGVMTLLACRGCGRYGGGHRWASLTKECPAAARGQRCMDDWGRRNWRKLDKLLHPTDGRLLQKHFPLAKFLEQHTAEIGALSIADGPNKQPAASVAT